MENKQYIVALEIGSSKIVGVLATKLNPQGSITINAVEDVKASECVRYGCIKNVEEVSKYCRENIKLLSMDNIVAFLNEIKMLEDEDISLEETISVMNIDHIQSKEETSKEEPINNEGNDKYELPLYNCLFLILIIFFDLLNLIIFNYFFVIYG